MGVVKVYYKDSGAGVAASHVFTTCAFKRRTNKQKRLECAKENRIPRY